MICGQKVALLVLGNVAFEVVPRIGEEHAGATSEQPVDLASGQQADAADDQAAQRPGVGLGVSERERTAPGTTKYHPAIDVKVRTQFFDVGDQVPGGVFFDASVRPTATGAALIEQDDPVVARVEKSSLIGFGAAAGAAVDKQDGLAVRIAALLEVHLMDGRHTQKSGAVRLVQREEGQQGAGSRRGWVWAGCH